MARRIPPRRGNRLIDRVTEPFQRFFALEASSSLLLLLATMVALAWANSQWAASYEHLIHLPLVLAADELRFEISFGHLVNDALMTVFFFVVGMEIKREMVLGELSSRSRALLPVLAAAGGMIVPAGLYAVFHLGEPTLRGWAIPMATDIAFAVAALSVFGARVPAGLKVFLLALAIADDIGAVTVIALVYTSELDLAWLGGSAAGLAFTYAMNRAGVRAYGAYLVVGGAVWLATHHSGVHATIAGVVLGFLTPARPLDPDVSAEGFVERGVRALERLGGLLVSVEDHGGHERHRLAEQLSRFGRSTLSPLDHLTNLLHPWVAFVVMPLFALCNAGIPVDLERLLDPASLRVGGAVALGLLVGKPVGITLFAWLAVRLGWAELPRGVAWPQIVGAGLLAGIGFTVALLVSALAFGDTEVSAGSKLGVLVGSAGATVLGVALLARTLPRDDAGTQKDAL
jgi:NhaA family Na+:H+ antiporter